MPYLPQLDGVRALAILIVFAAHCGYSHVIPGGSGLRSSSSSAAT